MTDEASTELSRMSRRPMTEYSIPRVPDFHCAEGRAFRSLPKPLTVRRGGMASKAETDLHPAGVPDPQQRLQAPSDIGGSGGDPFPFSPQAT
jgi:hypothetical protein